MYSAVAPIAATLLGFLVAAVAILVQLDVDRQIVKELRRGEAFGLLIVNLLTASTLLLVLTVAALAGPFVDSSEAGSGIFESAFEIVAWASLAELLLGGYFFGYVTIKVARFR